MVRLPFSLYFLSPAGTNEVLTNLISGYFSALKKSSDFRCLSRFSLSVLIEFTSAVKVIFASEKSSLVCSTVPSHFLNVPSASDTTMWVTVKRRVEWFLSSFQTVFTFFSPVADFGFGSVEFLSTVVKALTKIPVVATTKEIRRSFFMQ